jgi:SOS-response transcriptional repressor LexA
VTRFGLVDVSGPSMVPALRHGDLLLVRYTRRARPGQVVLARFADVPGYVVKRADHPQAGGWFLTSDNAAAGSDSRSHGPGEVVGRAVFVLRRWRLPRRVR